MNTKVFHVSLSAPDPSGQTEFYFGSLSAIFEVLSPDQVGCGLGNLYNHCRAGSGGVIYQSARATIREGVLIRKQTARGVRG
jgi:hypothetical protein